MSPSISFFKCDNSNEFKKFEKDRGLKIDSNVLLCKDLYGKPKVSGSARIADRDLTDPEKFQRFLHGVD